MQATFQRRETRADPAVLDDMREELTGRKWATEWRKMVREKAVAHAPELHDALAKLDRFVRPLLLALGGGALPDRWPSAVPGLPQTHTTPPPDRVDPLVARWAPPRCALAAGSEQRRYLEINAPGRHFWPFLSSGAPSSASEGTQVLRPA
jgi:hypothetical protein